MTQWRPYSTAEAAWFQCEHCDNCAHDAAFRAGVGDSCPIAAAGFGVAIGLAPPPEWQENEEGPHCTAFQPEESQ